MPSLIVQELLAQQERIRLEQLGRDAWMRHQLPATPARRWRLAFARRGADGHA
jgi:hypothetical protein